MSEQTETKRVIEEIDFKLQEELKGMLTPGEEVILQLKGTSKEALVCTDRRVIILKTGFMTGQLFGTNTFQLTYSAITGVQVKFSLLTGYFELSAGGTQNTAMNYWSNKPGSNPKQAANCISIAGQDMANRYRDACTFIMSRIGNQNAGNGRSAPVEPAPSASAEIFSALEKLGELKQAGILTDEEFQSKKAELLARL